MYLPTLLIITNSQHLHIKKAYDNSTLLNYHNECPQKYKIAIIKNLIHKEFSISSTTIFYKELINIKQTLVNDNFHYKLIDQKIKLYLQNFNKNNNTTYNNNTKRINLYYRNQMHNYYKLNEQAITNIIKRHIKPIEKNKQTKQNKTYYLLH